MPMQEIGALHFHHGNLYHRGISHPLSAAMTPMDPERFKLQITGTSCASCGSRVEMTLQTVPGVHAASVNLATEEGSVQTLSTVPVSALLAAVRQAGYQATDAAAGAARPTPPPPPPPRLPRPTTVTA